MVGEHEMIPPEGGATVRFYRIGHGDCFLIAFDQKKSVPFFVLIDCGCKNGSNNKPEFFNPPRERSDIARHIMATTKGKIDVAILTHEHDDHLNGIDEDNFNGLQIDELWLAWTEDDADEVARELSHKKKEDLDTIKKASELRAAAFGASGDEANTQLAELFSMEAGMPLADYEASDELGAAGESAKEGVNKRALRIFREAAKSVRYLRPHMDPLSLGKSAAQKAFVLGPPRDPKKIRDEDPDRNHAFPDGKANGHALSFAGAVRSLVGGKAEEWAGPFGKAYSVPLPEALAENFCDGYYASRYGPKTANKADANLRWRRIDGDWLNSADTLALKLNTGTNNTSLVIAFELTSGGKVLLFAADAQAGNWLSWNEAEFPSGGNDNKSIWPKELLKRTVLYKVGHHGSHNATLKGNPDDEWPNLSWLGQGEHAGEFTAMITAVREWAVNKAKWDHPLPSIEEALRKKADHRVFRTDKPPVATDGSATNGQIQNKSNWEKFKSRMAKDDLFYDLMIEAN